MATGDFNGDGIPDLVVTASTNSDSTVFILLGKGDGTFQTATSYDVPAGNVGIPVVGDFNKDGKLDVAVLALGTLSFGTYTAPSGVYLLLGNGDGTFRAAKSAVTLLGSPALFNSGGIVAGDFNHDGKMDLAIGESKIRILLGNGDGTFTDAASISLQGYRLDVGDFNKDGKLDLVASPSTTTYLQGAVQPNLLLGNGDGTFQTPTALPSGAQEWGAADFNKDGNLDLLVQTAQGGGPTGWTVLLGNGDGTFQTSASLNLTADARNTNVAIADFNGDGIPDLAFVDPSYQGSPAIVILTGKGNGTFTAWQSVSLNGNGLAAADFNKDGAIDLATISGGNAMALLNIDAATATASATGVTVNAGSIATHNLQCSYPGDANYAASVSNTVAENYTQAATPQFSLLVGIYPAGQQLSITDSVQGAVIRYTTDGSAPTSSSTQYSGPITINQTTTFKAAAFATGYTDSQVSTATYTIQTSGGSYAVAVPAVTVSKGSTGNGTATVSTTNGYVGVVTLSCSLTSSPTGAVDLPTCSAGQTVTLTSLTTSATATLSVTTTAASTAAVTRPRGSSRYGIAATGGLSFAMLLAVFLPGMRRRNKLLNLLLSGVVTIVLIGLSACGGSTPKKTDPGTTSGTYTFTVAGTGSDTAKTAATTTFNVTVP